MRAGWRLPGMGTACPAELAVAWRSTDRRPVLRTFLRCLAAAA
jgi:hypothetical protein